MAPYIFMERKGIHIIDLQKTLKYANEAYLFMRELAAAGGRVRRILADRLSLRRSFHLVRHGDEARSGRLERFANLLSAGISREVARLEALAGVMGGEAFARSG